VTQGFGIEIFFITSGWCYTRDPEKLLKSLISKPKQLKDPFAVTKSQGVKRQGKDGMMVLAIFEFGTQHGRKLYQSID